MSPHTLTDLRAIAALTALLLLPGGVIVRAPWPTIPFLSVSFWLVSWTMFPPGATGRRGFVLAWLVGFSGLLLLRLLQRSLVGPWRRGAGWALVAALLSLAPFAGVEAPATPDIAFDGLTCVLLSWKDGVPKTFEPLVPGLDLSAAPSGVARLAADTRGLSKGPAHRHAFLSLLAARFLLVLAIFFALVRLRRVDEGLAASVAAVATLGFALVTSAAPPSAPLSWTLALMASVLLRRAGLRSTGVAAGAIAAAALHADSASLVWVGLALVEASVALRRRARERWRPIALSAAITWVVLGAAPMLTTYTLAAPRELAATLFVFAAGLSFLGAAFLAASAVRSRSSAALTGFVLVAALALSAGATRPAFTRDVQAASDWLKNATSPMDVVCNAPGDSGRFLPVLAERAVTHPPLPPSAAPLPALDSTSCAYTYRDGTVEDMAAATQRFGAVFLRGRHSRQ